MIPLRDLNPTRTTPYATYTLVALNVLVFLGELYVQSTAGDDALIALVARFGVVPAYLVSGHVESWITPLTSMFLHGGWLHLLGNMWFLHIFGDNVEDHLGRPRFLVLYVAGGFVAALLQSAIALVLGGGGEFVPMVGASGAIAAVIAAYVRVYPRARILTLIPIFVFVQFLEVPAYFFVFVWFALQLIGGLSSLGAVGGGVAFFAHIGGFLAGYVLVGALAKPEDPGGWRPPRNPPRVVYLDRDRRDR